jgi:phage baseplate assembly protein W
MPLERVSRGFKDVSLAFSPNPVTNDLIVLNNERAIARSIRNLIFTQTGEKFFNPDLGTHTLNPNFPLFEIIDNINATEFRENLLNLIQNYEPRVSVINVLVEPDWDNNGYNITISYRIIGADIVPQQLEFAILPTR